MINYVRNLFFYFFSQFQLSILLEFYSIAERKETVDWAKPEHVTTQSQDLESLESELEHRPTTFLRRVRENNVMPWISSESDVTPLVLGEASANNYYFSFLRMRLHFKSTDTHDGNIVYNRSNNKKYFE